jgi:hypothetical protein
MSNDAKQARNAAFMVLGLIWGFFVLIWMPPLTSAVVFGLIWLKAPDSFVSAITWGVMRAEFVMPPWVIAYGLYSLIRTAIKTKRSGRLQPTASLDPPQTTKP